jgi:hypothetical protein
MVSRALTPRLASFCAVYRKRMPLQWRYTCLGGRYINDTNFDYPHLVSRVVSWILLGLGIYLSHKWYQHAWSYDFNLQRSYFDPHIWK